MFKNLTRLKSVAVSILLMTVVAVSSFAQSGVNVTITLHDSSDNSEIGFATVSITKKGATKALKYALTNDKGKATIEKVAAGTYTIKAEMMGYIEYTKEITVADKPVDIGVVNLKPDHKVLDAASVSAVGNSIIVKKDTIEYNAAAYRITENDMLEDLLKKFPGIEVGSDGSITANGQTISKIYVDGKTYFLDDPTLASKNLPAKIIEKVKVIQKKSDQAEFTGIDDGQEETVLDLSVKNGMMNGWMGNVRAGGGHDLPSDNVGYDDWRFSGNLFLGNFGSNRQISVIGNANNGNNMGFGGFGGQMMRGMGGGNGGVTTSYMLGTNIGYNLFDDKMEATGSYSFNGSDNDSRNNTYQQQYFDDYALISNRNSIQSTKSNSHNVGMRIKHEFSKNSSLIFEPQINFGTGSSNSSQVFDTYNGTKAGDINYIMNDGVSLNLSDQKSVSASSRLQYRQRLGLPGRTLVVNANLGYSNTNSDGYTQSFTRNFKAGTGEFTPSIINQRTENENNSTNLTASATYTEPMGHNFYLEGNYSLNWSSSHQVKNAYNSGDLSREYLTPEEFMNDPQYNPVGEIINAANSSDITNDNLRHTAGVNWLYQTSKVTAQIGASIIPTRIHNKTERGSSAANIDTTYSVTNWSPQIMVRWVPGDRLNMRFNYRGNSNQPSVSQLIPVLDNTNPIAQSLGNPYLNPYFSHNISTDIRYSNPRTFASFNARINGGFTQNPIVNATWAENGKTFSMPVNGPTRGNASLSLFGNLPIARSNFSISANTSASTSTSGSFVGSNVGTDKYYDQVANTFDYALFRHDYPDLSKSKVFQTNDTRTMSASGNLTLQYRSNALEIRAGGGTRVSDSKYSINPENNITTWNNNLQGSVTWNWSVTGISLKSDMNYRWYNGYKTEMPSSAILNAEISKIIFNGRATISANAYDILGQTRNFSSSQSGSTYSESTNNSIGRYILLQFTWRFGTFGGRSSSRGGNRGGGFGGGMPGGMGGGIPGGMGGGMPPM